MHVDAAAPLDEPNLYVVLSGFRDLELPVELVDAGVPLTCIIQIRTNSSPIPEQHVTNNDTEAGNSENGSRLSQDHQVEDELMKFWTVTRERYDNLSAYPAYIDIAVLPFHPPTLPKKSTMIEKESLKRDTYDEMFLVLQYLNDLCRQHAEYLSCMQLEERITCKDDEMDTKVYEDALEDIPNEYVNVPLILCAILLQVEANLARSSNATTVEYDDDDDTTDTDTTLSTTAKYTPASILRDKLEPLDRKYELTDEYVDVSSCLASQPDHLKVIPHADILGMITGHFPGAISLDDRMLRLLRDERIIATWQDRQVPTRSRSEAYACHISNIARQLDEDGRAVSYEEAVDYLHLLMFDKWIFLREREAQPLKSEEEAYPARSVCRAQSAPDLASSTTFSRPRRSRSDTEIDYGKPIAALTDCPFLFALTDIGETLLPGYLYKYVWQTRSYERPSLDEYKDVELLSARAFLQVAHECFQSFDHFAARYFEPTDSMLLYFSNNISLFNVQHKISQSTMRTPIGFWEFCKYIAKVEDSWVQLKWMTHGRPSIMDLTERFIEKPIEVDDKPIVFEDKCFMLPDSLKARQLKDGMDVKKIHEIPCGGKLTMNFEDEVVTERDERPNDAVVTNGETPEKKSEPKTNDVDTTFPLPPEKKLRPSSCADKTSLDLLGYDLGRLRVQVIYFRKNYPLAGGVLVQVEYENWLHGHTDLRVAVILERCTLRLSSEVDRRQPMDAFHLTTKRGILLSFCRNEAVPGNRYAFQKTANRARSRSLRLSSNDD